MWQLRESAGPAEALASASAALRSLATADVADLTAADQADALRALERLQAQLIAARSAVLAAFTATRAYEDDAAGSPVAWLRWQTSVTSAAAAAAAGWMRDLAAHPDVAGALAAGNLSASWARQVCAWTDRMPADCRAAADKILLDAAAAGARLADLSGLAEEMHRATAGPDTDPDHDGFEDRRVRLLTHFRGAGTLDGELTPDCAASLRAVLDSLSVQAGPEDTRTAAQRQHDALAEACRRLIAGGLPSRAGQPTQIQLHMSLDQLLDLPDADQAVAAWAGYGAAAPPGADCDASIAPIVTGHVDPDELAQQIRDLLHGVGSAGLSDSPGNSGSAGSTTAAADTGPSPHTGAMAVTAARELLIARAARLLSGPAGLAAYLRGSLAPQPAASVSLPLDLGKPTETIPAHIRRAVIARDKHCVFPGCFQPSDACQVHHVIPRSRGGPTSVDDCVLQCSFHHLVVIHRWGWKLTLNPDGTTTAVSPDRQRVLHSHAPPARIA